MLTRHSPLPPRPWPEVSLAPAAGANMADDKRLRRWRYLRRTATVAAAVSLTCLLVLASSPAVNAVTLKQSKQSEGWAAASDGQMSWHGEPPPGPTEDCVAGCRCDYRPFPFHATVGGDVGVHDFLLTVNCSQMGLADFPKNLPAVTQVLDFSGNSLQNLSSLPRLGDLLVLDLSHNWLRRVDNAWLFQHMQQLRVLRLSDNGLRWLDHGTFQGLGQLQELDLSSNRLQAAELHAFAGLTQLQVFRMDANDLYELKPGWFLSMRGLIELHLRDNSLVSLDAENLPLPRLQHLDLSQNRLHSIHTDAFAATPVLRFLNISGNERLRDFPADSLAGNALNGMDIVLADGLGLTRLGAGEISGLSTQELSVSYQPDLRSVGPGAFRDLPRLMTLQMHDCPKLSFLSPRAFEDLPHLQRLFIHNNALLSVPASLMTALPSLQELHLHHNNLRCDCNVYWLRKELDAYSRRFYASVNRDQPAKTTVGSLTHPASLSSATPPPTSTKNTSTNSITMHDSIISAAIVSPSAKSISEGPSLVPTPLSDSPYASKIKEPDQVACYFPEENWSMALVQQPLQYFQQTCTPVAMPFFPTEIKVSVGEPLDLECQGVGVPEPAISWVLPSGQILNTSSHSLSTRDITQPVQTFAASFSSQQTQKRFLPSEGDDQTATAARAWLREGAILHISEVLLMDSGTYTCRVSSSSEQDFSTVTVRVQSQPLALTQVTAGSDYIVVAWRGSIPRIQLQDFQLFYREAPPSLKSTSTEESNKNRMEGEKNAELDELGDHYSVQYLRLTSRSMTIYGLVPDTKYELCLVYKSRHRLDCRYLTTGAGSDAAQRAPVRSGTSAGIAVHVSRAQLGAGIGVTLGLLVVIWAALVVRRMRRRGRKQYQSYGDPLCCEEKSSIPLEGLVPAPSVAPSTPLTSSRTALLTPSQI